MNEFELEEKINQKFTKELKILTEILTNKFGNPDSGRNRLVFKSKNFVWKIPRNFNGIIDNDHEAYTYGEYILNLKENPHNVFIHYAKCRILMVNHIPILCMELTTTHFITTTPHWCDFIDCGQVGYNKHQKLVAFDYGRM